MMDGRKSAHRLVAAHARNPGMVVSAFHVISEKKLANPRLNLNYDIFVCGDDSGAVGIVEGLISEIEGLRPLKLGPGKLAYMAEISTPLLLNAMIRNKIRNPGIKIV
jgi:predicted dinucleotide-binding enzyme